MDELGPNHTTATGKSWAIYMGKDKFALLDYADYVRLRVYHWQAKKSKACWYAVRKVRTNGKTTYIKMHREIMNAPPGTHVHHKNLDSLDNRRDNLFVCTPKTHRLFHQ